MTPPAPPLAGRYSPVDRIATGGMGEVWRARDEVLQREIALKLLKAEYADSADFRERFLTEARNAGGLHHPNVVQVLDYGETDEEPPRPFIAMELVQGQPLSDLLRRDEQMSHEVAVDLIAQAASALGAAHAKGIVHRDVKPGNLLVTPEGQVKVTDFGISRATNAVPLTRTGELIGTPHYLSPEQVDGSSATPASDVYALGVILYEALAGRRPFTGDTPLTAALAHVNQPVPELPVGVPPQWAQIVRTALAKEPDQRFADGAAFASALRGEQPAAAAVPVGAGARAAALLEPTQAIARPASRRRVPMWLPWVALAAAGLLVIALLALNRDDPRPAALDPSTSPTPATVRIVKDAYDGRDADEVAKQLREAGFRARIATVANPDGQRAGTVADLSPHGDVAKGTLITISAYAARPVVQAPATKPAGKTKQKSKASKSGKANKKNPGKGKGKGKGNR